MKRDAQLEKTVERQLLVLLPQDVLDCVELHCGFDDQGQTLILEGVPLCRGDPVAVPPLAVSASAHQLSGRVRLLALGLEAWAGWREDDFNLAAAWHSLSTKKGAVRVAGRSLSWSRTRPVAQTIAIPEIFTLSGAVIG